MRFIIKIVSFIALLICIAWLAYKPGFDSAGATATALAALLSSFFLKKDDKVTGQTQHVSENSIGIQAGRDASVTNLKGK